MFSGEKAESSQCTCSVPENHADEVAASVLQSRSVSVSTKVTSDMSYVSVLSCHVPQNALTSADHSVSQHMVS